MWTGSVVYTKTSTDYQGSLKCVLDIGIKNNLVKGLNSLQGTSPDPFQRTNLNTFYGSETCFKFWFKAVMRSGSAKKISSEGISSPALQL